jgi:hypothetical protein
MLPYHCFHCLSKVDVQMYCYSQIILLTWNPNWQFEKLTENALSSDWWISSLTPSVSLAFVQ